MAITNFVPTIWSRRILEGLRGALVYGSAAAVNRDYEGEISNAGDTVKITSISAITVGTYTPGTPLSYGALTDDTASLVIDQAKQFAFQLDDVDRAQSADGGSLMASAMRDAAYRLAGTADLYIAAAMATDATAVSTGIDTTPDSTTAYENLVALSIKLDEADCPRDGRFAVITPAYHGLLLKDSRFVSPGGGSTATLENGVVGRAAGFTLLVSNNVPVSSGSKVIIAGHPSATTYAEQVAKTEAVRLESQFADGVRGLHLYGAKVIRSTNLVKFSSSV